MNQKQLLTVGGIVLGAGVLLYFFGGKLFSAVGGIFSGNNTLTKDTPYEGTGVAGTLGAAANSISGGTLSAAGSAIGSGLFSLFGSDVNSPSTYYRVLFPDGSYHAVGDSWVDTAGNFSYQGIKYRLGDDGSGQRIATALTTIYGSGAS